MTDEAGQPVGGGTGFSPVNAYTAFGEPVTYDAGSETWRVGFPAAGGMGGSPVTRYQYAGGFGYESGLITLQGVNPALPPVTLQHVGERWYDPALGRFVQRDPIGLAGGMNVYAYCDGNPMVGVDPSGRALTAFGGAIAGGIGGAIVGGVTGFLTGGLKGAVKGAVAGAIGGAIGGAIVGGTGHVFGGIVVGTTIAGTILDWLNGRNGLRGAGIGFGGGVIAGLLVICLPAEMALSGVWPGVVSGIVSLGQSLVDAGVDLLKTASEGGTLDDAMAKQREQWDF